MKMSSLLLSAVAAVAAVSLAPSGASARPKPPRWATVSITVTCDDKEDALCRGRFGLTVNADGTYTVGPEPGGTKIEESLSADELAMIAKHAEKLGRTSLRAKPRCDKGPSVPGGNQTVVLTRPDGKTLTVYQASIPGKGARCTVGNRSTAIELGTSLGLLLALHYPLPFPQ